MKRILVFCVVLTGFIYPLRHWTWGGGFLSAMGFVDFAGSGIVHMAGAAAALAGVMLLKVRVNTVNGEIFPFQVRIYHLRHWVPLFWGWVGLALMAARNYYFLIKKMQQLLINFT